MKKDKGPEAELKKLRKHAEKRLLERTADIETMPSEDIKKLIHELEVHQIELEIQNEELRQAQVDLEARHRGGSRVGPAQRLLARLRGLRADRQGQPGGRREPEHERSRIRHRHLPPRSAGPHRPSAILG